MQRLASEGFQELEASLKKSNGSNAWHSLMGDAAYSARAVVRMPLCDRVAPLPLRNPEKRPFNPVGVMRYSYGETMKVEWLCKEANVGLRRPLFIFFQAVRPTSRLPSGSRSAA